MQEALTRFRRYEKKYLTTAEQAELFFDRIAPYIQPDPYGETVLHNCYYDTPDHLLIRRSLEKPYYKEKLRIRCYGMPPPDGTVFVELKKKCDRIVYKRRVELPYPDALRLLSPRESPPDETQVSNEIRWMFRLYPSLGSAMALQYRRQAFFATNDPSLRLTVDSELYYRTERPELLCEPCEKPILRSDERLLELKISEAMPLWLADALDACRIYPTSFSKYGRAFRMECRAHTPGGAVHA